MSVQVTYDTSTSGASGTSLSVTVASNNDRILVAFFNRAASAPTGVQYNGSDLTLLQTANASEFNSCWYIINPDTGTHNLTWTNSSRSAVYSYYNVDGGSPFQDYGGDTSTGSPTVVLTAANTNGAVIGAGMRSGGAGDISCSPTDITVGEITDNNLHSGATALLTGTSTQTFTVSQSGSAFIGGIAVYLNPKQLFTPKMMIF